MFSFGASRKAYDRVYYKERIPHDRSLPGPGHYDQDTLAISRNKNKSFTMLGRIATECKYNLDHFLNNFVSAHIAVKVHNPGPGSYREKNEMSAEGRYVKSTCKNSCVPTFKLPMKKTHDERVIAKDFTKDNPGPGAYTPRETSSNNKYKNSYNLRLY